MSYTFDSGFVDMYEQMKKKILDRSTLHGRSTVTDTTVFRRREQNATGEMRALTSANLLELTSNLGPKDVIALCWNGNGRSVNAARIIHIAYPDSNVYYLSPGLKELDESNRSRETFIEYIAKFPFVFSCLTSSDKAHHKMMTHRSA